MPKSPLALVKERFKDKAGLVAAVKALATRRPVERQAAKYRQGPRPRLQQEAVAPSRCALGRQEGPRLAREADRRHRRKHKRSKDKGYRAGSRSQVDAGALSVADVANKRAKATAAAAAPKAKPAAKPAKAAKAPKAKKAAKAKV